MEMHLVHYKATHGNIKEALAEGAYDSLAVLVFFFEVRYNPMSIVRSGSLYNCLVA